MQTDLLLQQLSLLKKHNADHDFISTDHFIEVLARYVHQGGPNPSDWDHLTSSITAIGQRIRKKELPAAEVEKLRTYFATTFSTECMQGFIVSVR